MTAILAPEATQTWQIDASHTAVGFAVRHMMFATVRGQFGEVAGTITIDGNDLATTALNVSIGTASIDTRMAQRDQHLASPDFFDAVAFPSATFSGRGATPNPDGSWALPGTLTIKGMAKPVTLTVQALGEGKDPWGNRRAGWSASATIDRREFGLSYNQALETGGILVGNEVALTIEVQAIAAA